MNIDFPTLILKFDSILSRGLCSGVGNRDGQMCIEAAICAALDLPHGDNPECVASAVRVYKIKLNDAKWSSPEARAKGLRDLGIAQIGSVGIVDNREFSKILAERTIKIIIPDLFRKLFPNNSKMLKLADRCELEGSDAAAYTAADAASAAAAYTADAAAYTAADAASAAAYAAASAAAYAAASAAAADSDYYLNLSASIALDILKELKSPGCEWINYGKEDK